MNRLQIILISCIALLSACSGNRRISKAQAKKVLNDSTARIYSMNQISDRELTYYVTPDGKKILLRKVKGFNTRETVIMEDTVITESLMTDPEPGSVARKAKPNDPFIGSVRITPKTNYSTKKNESFATIKALYRKLKSKEEMDDLHIGHSDERDAMEDRNIVIKKAYLYTITIEKDNDLHLLLGNTPSYIQGTTRVFNAEISAIPPDGTTEIKNHMIDLRKKAIGLLGAIPQCGKVGYLQSNHRFSIRGSLFYDTHHTGSPAKCREVEGESAWEIHPVFDFTSDQ